MNMKFYSIKTIPGEVSYFSILEQTDTGYHIRLCHDKNGYQKVCEDFLANDMFELCLRTGYISEMPAEEHVVA